MAQSLIQPTVVSGRMFEELAEAMPELKMTVLSEAIKFEWKKTGFDALELQYRKVGTTLRQAADKLTVSDFEFAPTLTTPGVPERFEFRTVYLIKNQRVGQWSPIYTETFG